MNFRFIEYLLCFRANPLPERFTHLNQLCVEVLRGFSTINLKDSTLGKNMSTAGKLRPVEAQFQDEFYRVFNKVAGRGVPISSEWSRAGSGRVDFWIPGKKWAIELLRDYSNVDEHVSRFRKGGTYYEWLKEKAVEDWVVINCATVPPCTGLFPMLHVLLHAADNIIGHPEPKLFHAIFQNAYRELRIFDHNAKPFCAAMRLTD